MSKPTIAELRTVNNLAQVKGKLRTGSTEAVKFKLVKLAASEVYSECIIASYKGCRPVLVLDPAHKSQFMHRGC